MNSIDRETHIVAVHDDHNGDIHVYQREWNGDKPLDKVDVGPIKFDWYFLIDLESKDALMKCSHSDLIDRTQPDGDYLRVYCKNRNYSKWKRADGNIDSKMLLIKELKNKGIKTYEGDLSSYQRYMIDNDTEMGSKFRILYYDIETDDRGHGIEIGRDAILSFAAYDPLSKKTFYKASDNEAGLIKAALRLISKYDVIVGWNSDGFDLPYIKARARKWGLKDQLYNLMGVQTLDLMKKFQETYGRDTDMVRKFRTFSLHDVASYFVGYGKLDRDGTYEMFINDPDRLKEYNIRDVKLLNELEEKTGIVEMSIIKAQICGARLNEKTSGRVLDAYIIRAANKKGVHYETVLSSVIEGEDDFEGASFVGGHVFNPRVGLHRDVVLFDFSSLYPSIIRTFNISPETYLGEWDSGLIEPDGDGPFVEDHKPGHLGDAIGTPTNTRFKSEKGVMPALIHHLVVTRNKMRKEEMPKLDPNSFEYQNLDKKQYVYKILANAMYGILGAPFFRYYNKAIAESITRTGHYLVKEAARWFGDKGYETIYGDTDSIFVKIPGGDPGSLPLELKEHFDSLLKQKFQTDESFIVMDYKTAFEKFLIAAKKKYVGLERSGKLELTGFEVIKRDTIKYGADCQMQLFDMIIKNDADLDAIEKWLKGHMRHILEGEVPVEEITVYKKLTKKPEEFVAFAKGAKLPIHAKVYLDAKDKVPDLAVGSYIPFVIICGKPLDGIHPSEFSGNFDRGYYWNTRIYALLQRVLEVAFPDVNWDQYEYVDPNKPKRVKREPKERKRRVKVLEVNNE